MKRCPADTRTLLAELDAHADRHDSDLLSFRAGAGAALDCHERGGNRHDGITVSETGGRLKRWRPGGRRAVEGWEWMWDRITRMFAAIG